jgi:hypothetical protein
MILAALILVTALGAGAEPQATNLPQGHSDPYLLIVHRVTGTVRMIAPGTPDSGSTVNLGDLPDSGSFFKTGRNGVLTLRFHPDLMSLEARADSRFQLGFSESDAGGARRVDLRGGRLLLGLSREGPGFLGQDAHSRVRSVAGRVSFATDGRASVIYVLEGETEVQNRVTGALRIVRRGEKAVSDARGIRVTRAQSGELAEAGLGQNLLEVDFVNPVTGEFRTLEVEYEKSP